ncbi:MAG TPA: His/Gly/Thr/Pro-type tRNA ligase C-terminal domain-containing protein [Candidatus Pacearchaeota archaeon]|nr:His/Gly/Thr/Pro-type tRNA ligase C-terminal domain-containing protein [Candidatus Pacearchaeota archaeon]HPM08352.1 His/Gly/Thr/Pro-type tRNA ligase C-terminal domain-containing protein [Candidatus Pacearchaeota archaeon]
MKITNLFYKAQKEDPKDEASANAKLLMRAGFVDKLSGGIYTFLPLGFKVCEKVKAIIKEEVLNLGGQELLMPSIHPKSNWETTGRWDSMNDLYKLEKENLALGPTHEEVVVPLAKKYIQTYKDLPYFDKTEKKYSLSLFQFQTKFRNELRVKSGLLRTKEFVMKDWYSFHQTEQDLDNFYDAVKDAYLRMFEKMGIGENVYYTFASGGTFSQYSHEFQLLTDSGEDTIYICNDCKKKGQNVAINKEIKTETKNCPVCQGNDFQEKKAIEIANIFKLKTKFSKPFSLKYTDEKGANNDVIMGCYGIGIGRLVGAITEMHHDKLGIIWPENVAPFDIHLISLGKEEEKVSKISDELYEILQRNGFEVLYDDREKSAGEKFADADLIGTPLRVVVSAKTLESDSVEIKNRWESSAFLEKIQDFKNRKRIGYD